MHGRAGRGITGAGQFGRRSLPLTLHWESFTDRTLSEALAKRYCLYVLHHRRDGNRPYYIGKAKFFGPSQPDGYRSAARYNGGYQHLLSGLLRSGFTLYIAEIGNAAYARAGQYEQCLIDQWNPVQNRRRHSHRLAVNGERPWPSPESKRRR